MADEAKFRIDGTEYPIPQQNTFSIDEYGICHAWTGEHFETLEEIPLTAQTIGALMQIAYMRGNPGANAKEVRELIGSSNLLDAMESLQGSLAEEEADVGPPAQTPSEPSGSESPGETSDSQSTSGNGSTTSSDTRANVHSLGGSPLSEQTAAFRSTRLVS